MGSLKAEEKRLKGLPELEKDFETSISYANGVVGYQVLPKSGFIEAKVRHKSDEAKIKIARLLNTGRPETFISDEVEIIGLPNIKKTDAPILLGTTILQTKNTYDLSIFSVGDGVSKPLFVGLEVDVYCGRTEMSFSYEDQRSPLILDVTVSKVKGSNGQFKLMIDPHIWIGMEVLNLPYFIPTSELIDSINAKNSIEIILSKEGSNFIKAVASLEPHQNDFYMPLIRRLRNISKDSGKTILLPSLVELEAYIKTLDC